MFQSGDYNCFASLLLLQYGGRGTIDNIYICRFSIFCVQLLAKSVPPEIEQIFEENLSFYYFAKTWLATLFFLKNTPATLFFLKNTPATLFFLKNTPATLFFLKTRRPHFSF